MAVDPNMGFVVTVPGTTPGGAGSSYQYAVDITNALTTIGAHNHTPGGTDGVQVPTAGININADLNFNSHSATGLNGVTATSVNALSYTGYFSIYQFGAVGNGTTDDSGAFATAFSAMSSGGILMLPQGTFRISSNVTVPAGVVLMPLNSTIKIDNGIALFSHGGGIWAPPVQIFQFHSAPSVTPVQFGNWSGSGSRTGLGTPPEFYPQWWGAKGDGATDDQPAFQQAVNSVGVNANPIVTQIHGTGGTLKIPNGHYILNETLTIGSGGSTLRISGCSVDNFGLLGTLLHFTNAGSRCVVIGGEPIQAGGYSECDNVEIDHLLIWQDTTAGAALSIGTVGPASRWNVHDLGILCYNIGSATAYAIELDAGETSGEAEFGIFNNLFVQMLDGWTAPAIYCTGTGTGLGGQCDGIVFDNIYMNGGLTGTAPMIVIKALSSTGTGIQELDFRNIRMEAPIAGGFHIIGAPGIVIRDVVAGDNGATPLTANFIKVEIGPGAANLSNRIILENVWCDASVGTNAVPTLYFAANNTNQTSLICIGCSFAYVYTAANVGANIINIGSNFGALASSSKVPMGLYQDGIQGLIGISGTLVEAQNLRGSFTLSSGGTTGGVTFPNAETNSTYFLSVTPTSGNTATTAITGIAKTGSGFTVTIAATAGGNITYDWILIR
jgi:hypothetical protein